MKKIDLHTHTLHSDGTDSVEELLIKAEEAKLDTLAITDHNTVDGLKRLAEIDIKKYFSGNIMSGVEMFCLAGKNSIEVLGYDFDIEKMDKLLKDTYLSLEEQNVKILDMYIEMTNNLNIGFSEEDIAFLKTKVHLFDFNYEVYYKLRDGEKSRQVLTEEELSGRDVFYRLVTTNPNSKLYINYSEIYPTIEQVIDMIHTAGGKAFLAHPYIYKGENVEQMIEDICTTYDLDGIECYHRAFTDQEVKKLLEKAERYDLLISGGSDNHGDNRPSTKVGEGPNGNPIDKDIMKDWYAEKNDEKSMS